ncbi:hypothetical protein VTO73DRAFT_12032 [Trametes versicolor]
MYAAHLRRLTATLRFPGVGVHRGLHTTIRRAWSRNTQHVIPLKLYRMAFLSSARDGALQKLRYLNESLGILPQIILFNSKYVVRRRARHTL